ncbi:hypothetical protein ACFLZZ_02095 [Nanoarchaeota archaeon]
MKKKGRIAINTLILWIIAIVVLLVVLGFMFGIKDQLVSLVDKIGQLFRFG